MQHWAKIEILLVFIYLALIPAMLFNLVEIPSTVIALFFWIFNNVLFGLLFLLKSVRNRDRMAGLLLLLASAATLLFFESYHYAVVLILIANGFVLAPVRQEGD